MDTASFVATNRSWVKAGPDLVYGDADGDAITEIRIRDTNTDANSGNFYTFSTSTVRDGDWHTISLYDLEHLWFVGATDGTTTDVYEVQLFDGKEWSATAEITAGPPGLSINDAVSYTHLTLPTILLV